MIQILLLDDSSDKRESLKSVILPLFPKGDILIEEANCLVDGREKLQTKTYDMLILDMVLPEHNRDQEIEMNRRGGVELLEEIYSRSLKTIFQHKACTVKLYADSFYKVQKNSHSSFEVICCCS